MRLVMKRLAANVTMAARRPSSGSVIAGGSQSHRSPESSTFAGRLPSSALAGGFTKDRGHPGRLDHGRVALGHRGRPAAPSRARSSGDASRQSRWAPIRSPTGRGSHSPRRGTISLLTPTGLTTVGWQRHVLERLQAALAALPLGVGQRHEPNVEIQEVLDLGCRPPRTVSNVTPEARNPPRRPPPALKSRLLRSRCSAGTTTWRYRSLLKLPVHPNHRRLTRTLRARLVPLGVNGCGHDGDTGAVSGGILLQIGVPDHNVSRQAAEGGCLAGKRRKERYEFDGLTYLTQTASSKSNTNGTPVQARIRSASAGPGELLRGRRRRRRSPARQDSWSRCARPRSTPAPWPRERRDATGAS